MSVLSSSSIENLIAWLLVVQPTETDGDKIWRMLSMRVSFLSKMKSCVVAIFKTLHRLAQDGSADDRAKSAYETLTRLLQQHELLPDAVDSSSPDDLAALPVGRFYGMASCSASVNEVKGMRKAATRVFMDTDNFRAVFMEMLTPEVKAELNRFYAFASDPDVPISDVFRARILSAKGDFFTLFKLFKKFKTAAIKLTTMPGYCDTSKTHFDADEVGNFCLYNHSVMAFLEAMKKTDLLEIPGRPDFAHDALGTMIAMGVAHRTRRGNYRGRTPEALNPDDDDLLDSIYEPLRAAASPERRARYLDTKTLFPHLMNAVAELSRWREPVKDIRALVECNMTLATDVSGVNCAMKAWQNVYRCNDRDSRVIRAVCLSWLLMHGNEEQQAAVRVACTHDDALAKDVTSLTACTDFAPGNTFACCDAMSDDMAEEYAENIAEMFTAAANNRDITAATVQQLANDMNACNEYVRAVSNIWMASDMTNYEKLEAIRVCEPATLVDPVHEYRARLAALLEQEHTVDTLHAAVARLERDLREAQPPRNPFQDTVRREATRTCSAYYAVHFVGQIPFIREYVGLTQEHNARQRDLENMTDRAWVTELFAHTCNHWGTRLNGDAASAFVTVVRANASDTKALTQVLDQACMTRARLVKRA